MRREAFDSTQAAKKRQSAYYYLQNFDTRKECMTEIGRMLLVPPLNLQAHQGWNYPMPRRPTVVTELTQPSISQSADLSSPDPNKDPVSNRRNIDHTGLSSGRAMSQTPGHARRSRYRLSPNSSAPHINEVAHWGQRLCRI